MWLFHFRSIVKMPSFYSVFCLGCQRHFIGCPFGTSRKKHQPFSVAHRIFIQLVSFIILSCWWLLPAGTNSFRVASPPAESLGRGKEPFLEKDFSFPSTAPPLLFQRLSRLLNPCSTVLRDAAKRPLYRLSEKKRLKFLSLS